MLGIAILDLLSLAALALGYLAAGFNEGFSPAVWFIVLTVMAWSIPFIVYVLLALRGHKHRVDLATGSPSEK